MLKLAVIGTGYVGLVSGTCFSEYGYPVTCVDRDADKISMLQGGRSPIFEPGLEALIETNQTAGRLTFTTDLSQAVQKADIIFVAVGTPPRAGDGLPDLSMLEAVVDQIGEALSAVTHEQIVVIKSTVPVGTTRRMGERLQAKNALISVASNPEFLREGSAIKDFMSPDRIVIGVDSKRAHVQLSHLYEPICLQGGKLFATGFESAEMIKYTANCMLAAKVALINEISDICEALGANIRDVSAAVGMDERIGEKFLRPGPGFGGSCFPKDALALAGIARAAGAPSSIIETVIESNTQRKLRMADKIATACGGSLAGKTLAILGLTFKPGTDDMRESPSLTIIPRLIEMGATIQAYDPQGMEEARKYFDGSILYSDSAYEAMKDADALVILTEWNEFLSLDFKLIKETLRAPLIVDLRNIYKRRAMREAGFHYVSIGRGNADPNGDAPRDLNPAIAMA